VIGRAIAHFSDSESRSSGEMGPAERPSASWAATGEWLAIRVAQEDGFHQMFVASWRD